MALFRICLTGDDTFPNTVLLVDFLELVTSNSSLVSFSWQVGPGMSWDMNISSLPLSRTSPCSNTCLGVSVVSSLDPLCPGAAQLLVQLAQHLTCQQKVTILLKMGKKSKLFALLEHILNRRHFPPLACCFLIQIMSLIEFMLQPSKRVALTQLKWTVGMTMISARTKKFSTKHLPRA